MSSTPPILNYVEGFTVTGLSTRTQNIDEFNAANAKLPNLWQQFYASNLASNAPIFGVYSDYESDATGLYTVTAGVRDEPERAAFSAVNIHSGNYLVFKGVGPMPSTVVDTWKTIWAYFSAEGQCERNFISDFEAYSDADKIAIYIGIK